MANLHSLAWLLDMERADLVQHVSGSGRLLSGPQLLGDVEEFAVQLALTNFAQVITELSDSAVMRSHR